MERPLTVCQLASATGVPAKTIRYYEQVGVLPAAHRSPAGYRQYSPDDIDRLVLIRRARVLGLSLAQVKVLAAELDGDGCATMRPRLQVLVAEQLRALRQQIVEFQVLERQLAQVLERLRTIRTAPRTKGCRCPDGTSDD
jgi:DNA-binding transcriptional MerR regulator